jgi:hypothetical protein
VGSSADATVTVPASSSARAGAVAWTVPMLGTIATEGDDVAGFLAAVGRAYPREITQGPQWVPADLSPSLVCAGTDRERAPIGNDAAGSLT